MAGVRIEITGTEISSKEERLEVIKNKKLNELCSSVGINIDLNTFQDYTYDNLKTELSNFNSVKLYNLSENSIEVFTPLLEENDKFLTVKSQKTSIPNTNAKADENIVNFFKNCPFKEDLIFKKNVGVNFADLLFDHVLTVDMVPVVDSIILFRNYCFILKPFLNSFDEEVKFLSAFSDRKEKTVFPRFFIKDY